MIDLRDFPFTHHLDKNFISRLEEEHEIVKLEKGEQVVAQYEVGEFFYFLLEGKIEFSIKVDQEHEELKVGESIAPFTPVGWSGFREPYRYATTVSCVGDSMFLRWSHASLKEMIFSDPHSGCTFLKYIVFRGQLMLDETRNILTRSVPDSNESLLDLGLFEAISKSADHHGLDILKRSPFFEIYNGQELKDFAGLGKEKIYSRGDKIYLQGEKSRGVDVLIAGKVALVYASESSRKQDKRTIQNEGYIVGSGCFTSEGLNDVTCIALTNVTILRIDVQKLKVYLSEHPQTGVRFYLRILWFISNRLRSARARLITIKYDAEILAVKNLIEQNCTLLSVVSELHKVPYLLGHTFTLSDGIEKLHKIRDSGTTLEKSLANSSLEVLSEVVREHTFYEGLSHLYHDVVNAPKEMSHAEMRVLCARRFVEVFEETNYILKGEEHLPDEPSVFIYNHLRNHDINTLPNNFQLTLDSHFISSVVLYKRYGNPGIRVVRVPRGDEYGHQYYYERLGHIPVYTEDSASIKETKEEKRARRMQFYNMASDYLKNGTSIMLAPEGQSLSTGESPALFRPGAFRLPTFMDKEPCIVPIAIANFDKRLNHTTFSAVIKKPFKISEVVEDPNDKKEMMSFLEKYHNVYRGYVEEAIDLSRSTGSM